jgi:hypothetical protein
VRKTLLLGLLCVPWRLCALAREPFPICANVSTASWNDVPILGYDAVLGLSGRQLPPVRAFAMGLGFRAWLGRLMEFIRKLFRPKKKAEVRKKVDIARRFELIGRIGQGSMSKVWRARDTYTEKIVALKVLDVVKTKPTSCIPTNGGSRRTTSSLS